MDSVSCCHQIHGNSSKTRSLNSNSWRIWTTSAGGCLLAVKFRWPEGNRRYICVMMCVCVCVCVCVQGYVCGCEYATVNDSKRNAGYTNG